MHDCLGNTLTLEHASSAAAVDDFVEGFIASEARAANILQVAEADASPIVQAYLAALHMFAESRDARANAQPHIRRALQSPRRQPRRR